MMLQISLCSGQRCGWQRPQGEWFVCWFHLASCRWVCYRVPGHRNPVVIYFQPYGNNFPEGINKLCRYFSHLSRYHSAITVCQALMKVLCESITVSCVSAFCSDVWSLGCVLYELCTLRHPVLPPAHASIHHEFFPDLSVNHCRNLFCCYSPHMDTN